MAYKVNSSKGLAPKVPIFADFRSRLRAKDISIVVQFCGMDRKMLAFWGAIISSSGALISYYAGQYEMMLILVILGVVNMCRWFKLRKQSKH